MKILSPYLINRFIKIAIGIAIAVALYFQWSLRSAVSLEVPSDSKQILYGIPVIMLLPLNWYIESVKWRWLMSDHTEMTTWRALKSILAGLSLGIFTPARVGEYGGRILFVPAAYNVAALQSTFLCSIAQNLVSFTLGFVALMYFLNHSGLQTEILSPVLLLLALGFWTVVYLFYFNIQWIDKIRINFRLDHIKWLGRICAFREIKMSRLMGLLALSYIRYMVYTTQYVLVLLFFGVPFDGLLFISAVATIFLIQGSIPIPPFVGIIARGEIALLIWSQLDISAPAVLLSSYTIWIINILIPAIIGYFLIWSVNIPKTLGMHK